MIHGIVTRWKNRRRLPKKKRKLSDSTSPNDNLIGAALNSVLPFRPHFVRRRPAHRRAAAPRVPGAAAWAARHAAPSRAGRAPRSSPRTRPEGGEALGIDLGGAHQRRAARQAAAAARPRDCSRPSRAASRISASASAYSTSIVSLSATGKAKPARCSRPAASRRSAKGETRGLKPPSISLSAAPRAWRSCQSVPPPSIAPRNSPSGFRMRRDLDQRAGQVVHPMQAPWRSAPDRSRRARTAAPPRRRPAAGPCAALREAEAEVGADQRSRRVVDGPRERAGDLVAMAAEIERQREGAAHVGEPLDQPARRSRASGRTGRASRRAARSRRWRSAPRSKTRRGSGCLTACM